MFFTAQSNINHTVSPHVETRNYRNSLWILRISSPRRSSNNTLDLHSRSTLSLVALFLEDITRILKAIINMKGKQAHKNI